MARNITDLSGDALFQLRVRQAILAAQHSIKQVGLLIIDFDGDGDPTAGLGGLTSELTETLWLRLKGVLRDSDTVVRMDEGRMAVLLPSVNGPEDVALVASKILRKFESPLSVNESKVGISPRIGMALFPEHSTNANTLMQRAALALDAAKRTKSNYVLYSHGSGHAERAPLKMSELRQAIVSEQLLLLYQPKVDLKSSRISGLEVLTRWRHPKLGVISPDEFIPVAERTGLIIPLTLWVLHESLLQCRAWNKMGIDVSVAVNLSMWNLESQELPDQIEGMLKSVGVSPDRLEFEITESAIMGDPQRMMRILSLIRDLGVTFAIDDFGTGYSSLSYLKKLPVAVIKIDKSFVQNMDQDRDNAVIVRSIIDLGHNLGLKVVAEGVETCEAKEMLKEFRCDEAQGYYHSRPMPGESITELLTEPSATISKTAPPGDQLSELPLHLLNGINGKPVRPIGKRH